MLNLVPKPRPATSSPKRGGRGTRFAGDLVRRPGRGGTRWDEVTEDNTADQTPKPPCACCWDDLTYSAGTSSLCARCRIDGLDYPTWAHCQREAGYPEALITRQRYLADTAPPTRRTT